MTTYLGLTEVLASSAIRAIANSSSSLKAAISHGCMTGLVSSKKKTVGHQALVNGWSLQGAFDYVDEAFDVWRERSRHAWQLDISWLGTQGIKLQDETAAEGDNIPVEDKLSLKLEVPPVATESTGVPAVVEQVSIPGDVRPILNDNPVSRSSSAGTTFWLVCQRVFYQVKKSFGNNGD